MAKNYRARGARIGHALHPAPEIEWVDGSLPRLERIADRRDIFDLAVLSAVWQHLTPGERQTAMAAILPLLKPGAILVMSLRHGPPPKGRRSFEVTDEETIALSAEQGGGLLMAPRLPLVQALNCEAGVIWS